MSSIKSVLIILFICQNSILSNKIKKKMRLTTKLYSSIQKQKFDCQKVSSVIKNLVKQKLSSFQKKPKVTIILAEGKDRKANPASQIYVKKKLQQMPQIGILSELVRVTPEITKEQMEQLIHNLNKDPDNTSTLIQLPFPSEYSFDVHEIIGKIQKEKNIDGFTNLQSQESNLLSPKSLKPPTALGISVLLSYYGIQMKGLNVVIVGKGSLVGAPLNKILSNFPFYGTVTSCDIYTKRLPDLTRDADIIIAACGEAQLIKQQDVKQKTIIVDAGINQVEINLRKNNFNSTQFDQSVTKKRKIIGDVSSSAYHKSKYYTPVPGGVGLLTVSCLAFNVLNSYLLQNKMPTIDLQCQLRNYQILDQFMNKLQSQQDGLRVLLISSAYNGLTQRVERVLKNKGYTVGFQAATSPQAMRAAVNQFNPQVIVCPTLMKAIPEDIYKKIKCFIVHPGIKGDRGPSSIDWAILDDHKQWGVTILQADKQMDAGDIWASQNFSLRKGESKVEIYNKSVSSIAQKLILRTLQNFTNTDFKPQKLDYHSNLIKGKLHRTIKTSDNQRFVDWENDNTQMIMKKALAAETHPGLKVNLTLNNKTLTKFSYGYTQEKQYRAGEDVKNGEIFLRKLQAVCVKTKDGAVWIRMLRNLKSKENPLPFKVPSTMNFSQNLIENIPQIGCQLLEEPNNNTFQQITFERKGEIGILGFDFYNGAMTIQQCQRLNAALNVLKQNNQIKILILKGSERNWSNGLHLNVIQHSNDPKKQAFQNIKAINQIIKTIYLINDKFTISAIQANAGAGGVYLGLSTDLTFAKQGIVLNPHYKKMGLFGSELQTLTAARKFGFTILKHMKETAQPMTVSEAEDLKVLNKLELKEGESFLQGVIRKAEELIADSRQLRRQVIRHNQQKKMLFRFKSLEDYEKEQLREMQKDIIQDRNEFSKRRWEFVRKQCTSS